jgi:hypothetical protein
MPEPSAETIDAFITKWSSSGGHERGSGQYFLLDFCDLLGLEKPAAPVPENELNAYTFERRVDRRKPDGTSTPNWIDLYKSGHIVLETKQGVNARRDKSDPDQPLLPALDKGGTGGSPVSSGHGQRGSATWDKALERAHKQGERYIHLLPLDEGRPPFLIVCDVGHCFDLYAEFSGTGGQYEAFPDPRSRRILLKDLHRQEVRDLFRKIWHDPHSLDPSKHAAAVTQQVARALADLAKSLEKDGHDPQVTAGFLQRCLFTMFAEDIGLLPENSFLDLLQSCVKNPAGLVALLRALWQEMNCEEKKDKGSNFSTIIRATIPWFNGGLFKDSTALPLRADQIAYLIHAAEQDWSAVEPAIFGTLLERALDPHERHKLGAHYTPRSYVERLVRPALVEPLRDKWEAVKTAAAQLDDQGKTKEARAAVETFHRELAAVRVLDPACGSGNFLYVCLALLKTLEAEVLELFEKLGGNRSFETDSFTIRPTNFLGIELNSRAAAIAQLVLWIGYFQWHKKTTGKADTNDRPLLPRENTIECRDAVLAYDEKIPRRDPETGEILTIWDGRTTKTHPVTGKDVPDERATTPLFEYTNPRPAKWPTADFIVGNPPFIGKGKLLAALGEGYVTGLRKAWQTHNPDSWDFVLFWWHKAAEMVRDGEAKRFGFITTNSIHQTFNRRCLESFLGDNKKPIYLDYAIPDHPWVDSADGAAVRIALSVAVAGQGTGKLDHVMKEITGPDGEQNVVLSQKSGKIAANFKVGADTTSAVSLAANLKISCLGLILGGQGFKVSKELADAINQESQSQPKLAFPIWNGNDVTDRWVGHYAIDAFGLSEAELSHLSPTAWQHLKNTVYPVRQTNRDPKLREFWWLFRRANTEFRSSTSEIGRFVVTSETAKHRVFQFLGGHDKPEHKLVVIAHDDAYILGLLSTSIHLCWSVATGSKLGVGNDLVYVKTRCFETFPFPALEEGPLKQRIRDLGERLDAHRKARQAAHPELTLTGIYNVLEKLRAEQALTDKEKKIHDQGLVTLLKQIHDDLDEAVFEAYGWPDIPAARRMLPGMRYDFSTGTACVLDLDPATLDASMREAEEEIEQELLKRLVALNHERAAEEQTGLIRWLRPEYQAPATTAMASQPDLAGTGAKTPKSKINNPKSTIVNSPLPWPASLPDQVAAIQKLLPALGPDPEALAAAFGKRSLPRAAKITEILETLRTLGKL